MALQALCKFEVSKVADEVEGRPVYGEETVTYNEGDPVTKDQLKKLGQTDDQIADLVARGVIGEAE